MSENERDPVDAVAYVLGELDGADEARARAAERDDPAFRAEVARLRPAVEGLRGLPREAWDPVEPPPLRVPLPAVADVPRRAGRRFVLRPIAAAAAAFVLVAAGAGLGALVWGRDDASPGGPAVALRPVGDADGDNSALVRLSSDRDGEAQLVVERLQPTGDGEFYELWLLNSADDLVSLGSFRVPETGRTTVALPLPVDADRFQFFDVSREPLDGNPGHSSESVLRGPTV